MNMSKMLVLCIVSLMQILNVRSGKSQDLRITPKDSEKPTNFEYDKPIFKFDIEQSTNKHRFLRFSVLTGYREGILPVKDLVNFDSYLDTVSSTVRLYSYNLSIQDMLTSGSVSNSRVVLEVTNPSRYRYDRSQGSKLDWMRANAHCFEFLLPFGSIKDGQPMFKELADLFGVTCRREKRLTDVCVLKRNSNNDKVKSKMKGKAYYTNDGHYNNMTITEVIKSFNEFILPPIIDETGYKFTVDLDLHITDNMDISFLKKQFNKYDFDLVSERRVLEMFIINENNRTNEIR